MRARRTEAPEQRRAGLLDAAVAVLLDKGSTALTVDEITARAGVAKGTFYLYFRSKEQVLAALQERFVDQLVERQAAELAALPGDDWMRRLELWMESSIRGYVAQADLHDALFVHPAADRAPAESALSHGGIADPGTNRHAQALAELLEAGTAAGTFDLPDPRATAVLLYSAMHGAADYLIGHHGTQDATARAGLTEQLVAESTRLCRRLTSSGNTGT